MLPHVQIPLSEATTEWGYANRSTPGPLLNMNYYNIYIL